MTDVAYSEVNRFAHRADVKLTREQALRRQRPFSIIDPSIDEKWAVTHRDSGAPNSYFDYYFAAEDVRVYVAELGDDPEFGDIPIHELGFNVTQEKAPIYGAFSYTYDAVMRGTRIVTGSFTVVTKYADYMRRLLEKAAVQRHKAATMSSQEYEDIYDRPARWINDDENIHKYWGRHIDYAAAAQGQNEFSIHPPFSLVIVYGIQDTSVTLNALNNRFNQFGGRNVEFGDQALMKDRNQRLVENTMSGASDRIIIDACELTSVARVYSPSMGALMEQYEFFARDYVYGDPALREELPNTTSGGTQLVD